MSILVHGGDTRLVKPVKVIDVELTRSLPEVDGLDGYAYLQALVRFRGTPLGYAYVAGTHGRCRATDLLRVIVDQHGMAIVRILLQEGLLSHNGNAAVAGLLAAKSAPEATATDVASQVTVAVCTRDRTEDLARCLATLRTLEQPPLEILVVDNVPSTDGTRRLVAEQYPDVRYVCEPRPGLDWARNRAIEEARGEIVAYTDDDAVVDPRWVRALAGAFEDPTVMAVTGLVVPLELETEAQVLFERYGGFGRGFEPKTYNINDQWVSQQTIMHPGKFGTGANMAFRRKVFETIGRFDPALDVGTVTNGGGDLDMFFRVLKHGYTLRYEPTAFVRHRHRREYAALRTQITNNGIGFYSYLVRSAVKYPEHRYAFIKLAIWWLCLWNVRRVVGSFIKRGDFPRDLMVAELRGSLIGLGRYFKSRRVAEELSRRPAQSAR